MKPKSIFKSRTAVLAIITALAGGLSCINADAEAFVSGNAGWILLVLGGANLALRRLTSDRVTIFPDAP